MSWFSVPDSLTKLTGLVSSVGDQIKTAIDQAGASDQTAKNSNEYDLGVDNCAPWVSENPELKKHEPELKALVLQITAGPPDEVLASFLEAVPPNSNFDFDFEQESPRSLAAIKADPRLDDIRLKLVRLVLNCCLSPPVFGDAPIQVPLKMKDPELFKRYFYKVSIVRQEFYKGCIPVHSGHYLCFLRASCRYSAGAAPKRNRRSSCQFTIAQRARKLPLAFANIASVVHLFIVVVALRPPSSDP